jgi:outer membrane protein
MKTSLAALCAVSSLLTPIVASAAPDWMKDGKNGIAIGQAYLMPQESSSLLSLGALPLPSTKISLDNSSTLMLTYSRSLGSENNYVVDIIGGIPPKFNLHANGLGQKIGTVRQFNPAVVVRRNFGNKNQRFRPFVGIGATYVWYDDIKFEKSFENVLKLDQGRATVSSKLKTDFQPIVALGASYAVSEKIEIVASVAYTPLSTQSTIVSNLPDGSRLVSRADLQLDPIIATILFGYKF